MFWFVRAIIVCRNPRGCVMQDAQNAVATRVLFELFGEEQALHHSMASPFKDLWLRCVRIRKCILACKHEYA